MTCSAELSILFFTTSGPGHCPFTLVEPRRSTRKMDYVLYETSVFRQAYADEQIDLNITSDLNYSSERCRCLLRNCKDNCTCAFMCHLVNKISISFQILLRIKIKILITLL